MKPLLCFSECECVKKGNVTIHVLFQKGFDGKFIFFEMRCLFCDKVLQIEEPFEHYSDFREIEAEVMSFLSKKESDYYLKLALEGKTYSFSKKYNPKQLYRR